MTVKLMSNCYCHARKFDANFEDNYKNMPTNFHVHCPSFRNPNLTI